MTATGPSAGALSAGNTAGRDVVTVNLAQGLAALGGRFALAPPAPGEWPLVGRSDELARLHEHLARHGQATVVPVAGTGGIGKTALAMGYVAAHGEGYDVIAWVDAERPELIAGQYRTLVRNATTHDVTEADAVAAARTLLASRTPALVVFDNATTAAALHPYLPSGGVTVLVTTRNETWTARREVAFELEYLAPEVVVGWLGRELATSAPADIAALAKRLGGLPLAVVQALAYLAARPGTTAGGYVALLTTKDGQRKAYGSEAPPGYPLPVAATWDLAIQALATEAPAAVELLGALAFVAPDRVPIAVLDGLLGGTDVADALAALRRYGLVRAAGAHLRLHRLVQDITRWSLDADREAALVAAWAAHLEASAPDAEDHRNFAWFADVAPHVLALMDHAEALGADAGALARAANQTGISLRLQASFRPADDLLVRALAIKEAAYGPDHPSVAVTLTNLGLVRQDLGDHAGAVEAHQRALAIKEAAYRPDHPSVAITLASLGLVRRELGDQAGAVEAYERALAIFEAAYGPQHPQVAITLANLGIVRQDLGDPAAAVDAHERALAIFEAAYGPPHPHVAMTLTNLGNVRQDLGDHAGAVEAYERALVIKEATYGPDHPQVAITLTNLGFVRRDLGDPAGAVDAHERALVIFEATYGPDHGHTRYVRRALGRDDAPPGAGPGPS